MDADAAACAGMELGMPRGTIAALAELHQLLIAHGFRRSSSDGSTIVQEKQRENSATISTAAPVQYSVRFGKAARNDPCGAPNLARPAGQPAARGCRRRRRGE